MLISSFRSGLRIIAGIVGSILLVGPLAAQVALGTGTYTQNFDSLAGGLPVGWSVRTAATATALGTPATLNVGATTSWANTAGQWQHNASATGMTGAEATGVQNAST